MANRARTYERGFRAEQGLTGFGERFVAVHGHTVLYGPCAGLRLCPHRVAEIDSVVPKLLGTYELEIHGALEEGIARSRRFIDIGSADGYYAVGIATRGLPVEAYDLSSNARNLLHETAGLNKVDVTALKGVTVPRLLASDLTQALLLCDIDGPERYLFTSAVASALRTSHVIIELHERANPDVAAVLTSRFERTHEIRIADFSPRNPSNYDELKIFPELDQTHAVDDRYRTDGRRWLIAIPR